MRVHVYYGNQDDIRDAMAKDAAQKLATTAGVRSEDVSTALAEKPERLVDFETTVSLFDESRVLLYSGSVSPKLLDQIAKLSTNDSNNDLILSVKTAPKAPARVQWESVVATSGKTPAETAKIYLLSVGLSMPVVARLTAHVGKELSRLPVIVTALRTNFSDLSQVGVDEALVFAGPRAVPAPWDLTDAIDAGNAALALTHARAFQEGKGSAYGVIAILARHFSMMYQLSAAGISSEQAGAQMLGIKGSTYPVKKAITNARRYGNKLERMVQLVDQAGADLKGGSALDRGVLIDILISRLCVR